MAETSASHSRWLAAVSLRYFRVVALSGVALILLGGLAWHWIPRREAPRITDRHVGLLLPYPGAAARLIEAQVLPPIEEALFEVEGVDTIEATATPGRANFLVEVSEDVDLEVTAERLRGAAEQRRALLPKEVEAPIMRRISTDRVPQLVVAVVGPRSEHTLSEAARDAKAALSNIKGVTGVELWGESEPRIVARMDSATLAAHGLDITHVERALRSHNVRVPAGHVSKDGVATLLEVQRSLADVASVKAIPLRLAGANAPALTLGDVADIRREDLPRARRFSYQGQPAVGLALRFSGTADAQRVDADIKREVDALRKHLPPHVELVIAHSLAEWTQEALSSFFESLAVGVLLVMAVVWLGLGLRASAVVAWVLPLSVAGALLGLYLLGFAVEQLTIAGIIIAMGLLVDDALVVTDSIQLLQGQGFSRTSAAIEGTARVFWANNFTTAIACAAFLPLFFMGGTIGQFIRGLPVGVVLCLVGSLFVAQVITPWLSTLFLRHAQPPHAAKPARHAGQASEEDVGPLLAPLVRWYRALAPRIIRHPWWVLGGAAMVLAASCALLPYIGFEFFPRVDKPLLFATIRLAPGRSLDQTAEKVAEATAIVRQDPAVLDTSATVGHGYVNIFFGSRTPPVPAENVGDLLIRLKDKSQVATTALRLRRALRSIPAVDVKVEELRSGLYVAHPITVRLFGRDYQRLRGYAEAVEHELATLAGTEDIQDNLSETLPLTRLELDATSLARADLTPAEAAAQLAGLSGQREVTTVDTLDEHIELYVEESERDFAQGLGATQLGTRSGEPFPVGAAGESELSHDPARLLRRDGRRVVEVTADLAPGVLADRVLGQLEPFLRAQSWEPGYDYAFGGNQEKQRDSFQRLGMAALGAVLIIAVLLVVLFQSFRLSLAVLAAVPFGLIGALLGLAITGRPLGFMSFLGIIALLGVYTNHKVYLVDRIRELHAQGLPLARAITQAGVDRVRPVVLTALTAVLGLLPLAIHGGNVWASFAWPNIFGLLASVPLSLVLVPALVVIAWREEPSSEPSHEPQAAFNEELCIPASGHGHIIERAFDGPAP